MCNDKKERIWEKYLQGEGTDHANLLKQTSGRVVQGLVCEHRLAEKERRGEPDESLRQDFTRNLQRVLNLGELTKWSQSLQISLRGVILLSRDRLLLSS